METRREIQHLSHERSAWGRPQADRNVFTRRSAASPNRWRQAQSPDAGGAWVPSHELNYVNVRQHVGKHYLTELRNMVKRAVFSVN